MRTCCCSFSYELRKIAKRIAESKQLTAVGLVNQVSQIAWPTFYLGVEVAHSALEKGTKQVSVPAAPRMGAYTQTKKTSTVGVST